MKEGEFLRYMRKKKGIKAKTLAAYSGIDHTYISKLENGKLVNKPSLPVLRAFSECLDIPLAQMLTAYGKCPHCEGTGNISGN